MLNKIFSFVVIICTIGLLISCKKDPSILKVYVRSNNHVLTPDAKVRIVGDISENTPEHFQETRTNESGVATFNLDDLFDSYDSGQEKVAIFTLYAKDSSSLFTSKSIRTKAYVTSTETITLAE
ncbi:MAG: hypothetical protein WEA99_14080 [Brumimicrobium sp.]